MVCFVPHFDRFFSRGKRCRGSIATIVRCGLLVLTSWLIVGPAGINFAVAQPVAERADDRFLRQLTERGFFELAEQHCRQQRNQATEVEGASAWQLRLMETYRQHAWFASSDNRRDLLNQSLELLTEFLKDQVPAPETEFRLRLEQVQTLVHSLRMTLILTEAGHLFASEELPHQKSDQASAKTVVTRGIELVTSLQQQLENMRRDLDALDVRDVRDECRVLLAELLCLQWRMTATNSESAQAELMEAEQALQTASRTVTDRRRKHRLKWLTAELALWSESQQQFQLRMGALKSDSEPDDFTVPEFLQIRHLLKTQEATAAVQLATEAPATTALQMQQRDWLKLEALLGVRELLGQLNDAVLIQAADQDFQRQWNLIRSSSAGVFADAAMRTQQRYALVSEVGADIADLIEQVDRQRQNGDSMAALRLIEVTLNRLSSGGSGRAVAALNLRGGELLIEQQQWSQAKDKLETADKLYAELQMHKQQAVADLLRIYVLAKQWAASQNVAADPASAAPVAAADSANAHRSDDSKAHYVAALQQHLQRFADQATAGRAQDWLLQAVRDERPYLAAGLLLDKSDAEQQPSAKLDLLQQAGYLLMTAAPQQSEPDSTAQNISAGNSAADLRLRFQAAAESLAEKLQVYPADQLATVQLLLLEFEIRETSASSEQWQQRDQRLSELRKLLNAADVPEWAVPRATMLQALTAARSSADSATLSRIRQQLLQLDPAWQQTALSFLVEACGGATAANLNNPEAGSKTSSNNDQEMPGSIWLASTCEALIDRLRRQPGPHLTVVQNALRLLPQAALVSRITGRSAVQDQLLQQLLAADLQAAELDLIANALSQTTSSRSFAASSGTAQDSTSQVKAIQPVVQRFWRQVLQRHAQGSDLWLEASLQLAAQTADAGNSQAARRQLLVVQTLYPDWGDPQRQQRAAALQKQIEQQQTP